MHLHFISIKMNQLPIQIKQMILVNSLATFPRFYSSVTVAVGRFNEEKDVSSLPDKTAVDNLQWK